MAKIRALPKSPPNVRPAKGSLVDALRNAPRDPKFDLDEWNRQWAMIEAEMKAITKTNDIAEGRQ